MNNIAFIPVRGGSKRLPRKNLKELNGRSITHRAIDACINSEMFSKIIVSTDDNEIIDHCKIYNNDIQIDYRDPSLADDYSTVKQVINEFVERYHKKGEDYDTVSIVLATCPFRSSDHIKEAYKLYSDNIDGVIGVTEYDFPWDLAMELDGKNNIIYPTNPSPYHTGKTRSQDCKKMYHPNGSMYITKWTSMLKNKNYFAGNIRGYIMDKMHSLDIDTPEDFLMAEFLSEKGLVK